MFRIRVSERSERPKLKASTSKRRWHKITKLSQMEGKNNKNYLVLRWLFYK